MRKIKDKELYKKAEKIVVKGHEAGTSPDLIKAELIMSGIPFSKVSSMYRNILYSKNLIKSAKEITENICLQLDTIEFEFNESFETLYEIAEGVKGKVEGSSMTKIMNIIKAIYEENDKIFPRKTSVVKGRMGNTGQAVVEAFYKNSEVTEKELSKELKKGIKKEENRKKYLKSNYKMLYAVANKLSVREVLFVLSKKRNV